MGSEIGRKGLSPADLLKGLRAKGIDIEVGEGYKEGIPWAVFKYGESLSKKMQEMQELFPRAVRVNKFLIGIEKGKASCCCSVLEGKIIINLDIDPANPKFNKDFQSAVDLSTVKLVE